MAKTRVHELAIELGVESRWVLDRFKEMGEFVKSASSTVSLPAEMRFRKEYGDQLMAGVDRAAPPTGPVRPPVRNNPFVPEVSPSHRRRVRARRQPKPEPRAMPKMAKPLTRAEREALKPPRQTAWTLSVFDATGEGMWRRAGLGDNDADLAMYLLEHGVLPDDLGLMLRGRRASARLREGMESRSVLVKEILEARSKGPVQRRPLPSTKVERRRRTG